MICAVIIELIICEWVNMSYLRAFCMFVFLCSDIAFVHIATVYWLTVCSCNAYWLTSNVFMYTRNYLCTLIV